MGWGWQQERTAPLELLAHKALCMQLQRLQLCCTCCDICAYQQPKKCSCMVPMCCCDMSCSFTEIRKDACFILGLLAVKPEYQHQIAAARALPGWCPRLVVGYMAAVVRHMRIDSVHCLHLLTLSGAHKEYGCLEAAAAVPAQAYQRHVFRTPSC